MVAEPLVSVIVPAWNSERTLAETLRSVAEQSYRSLEIIVIDDGSADSTAAIAQQFCASDTRARLVRTENRGVSCARNRGIAEARGEWVAPIDADDIWHPAKVEKQVGAALVADEPPGFVYCWYRQIDDEGRLLASGPRLRLSGRIFNRLAYMNPVENGSAPLFSRAALEAVGGYDPDLPPYEDPMVQLRIARRYPVALVPEHLVGWRRHAFNASNDTSTILERARVMYRRLSAEEASLPRHVGRWVLARNALELAEQRARSGRLLAAFKSLAQAISGDPVRTSLQIFSRTVRVTKKQLIRPSSARPQPLFAEINPASSIETDAFAVAALAKLVEHLDQRRLRHLGRRDSYPGSGGGKLARELPTAPVADANSGQREQA